MAIDTSDYLKGKKTLNSGRRHARQFWKDWSKTFPNTLSRSNTMLVSADRSPIVDGTWIKRFPEHAPYEGEILVHHHLNYGPLAIPLPASIHSKQPGWAIWHAMHSGGSK